MIVSTGVGGGIVLDGRLLDGAGGQRRPHRPRGASSPTAGPCRCGGRGCLEAEASGPAIAAVTGRPAAEAGPEVVERTGRLVGRAVASVANLLDLPPGRGRPGRWPSASAHPFFAAAQAELDARARLDFSRGTRIVPAGLGADGPAGRRGRGGLAGPRPP